MYSYGPPTYDRAKAGRPARTYIQQLCEDTGCFPEDLPRAMNDREEMAREGQGISVLPARHDDDDDGITINPQSECLGKERENIWCHYLFGDKIIENGLKINATFNMIMI